MPPSAIRPYRDDDLDQVLEVWYRASLIAHDFLPDGFFEAERRAIGKEWMPVAETIVHETDGHVDGFLSLIGAEVGAIFVDPDRQRSGIGRALMDAARARRSTLELDVFEANTIGQAFYESYGFEVAGRHADEATGFPALRLRLAR